MLFSFSLLLLVSAPKYHFRIINATWTGDRFISILFCFLLEWSGPRINKLIKGADYGNNKKI